PEVEPAVVERPPRDHALDAVVRVEREHADVVESLHTTAGDDRQGGAAGEVYRRLDVATLEQAVAANVGEQQAGDARVLEAARHVGDRHVRHFGPAFGRDHPVAGIDGYDDAVLPLARHVAHELRILERGGADHHSGDTEVEPAFDRFGRA